MLNKFDTVLQVMGILKPFTIGNYIIRFLLYKGTVIVA